MTRYGNANLVFANMMRAAYYVQHNNVYFILRGGFWVRGKAQRKWHKEMHDKERG